MTDEHQPWEAYELPGETFDNDSVPISLHFDQVGYGHFLNKEGLTPQVNLEFHMPVGYITFIDGDGAQTNLAAVPVRIRVDPDQAYDMVICLLRALNDAESEGTIDWTNIPFPILPSEITDALKEVFRLKYPSESIPGEQHATD